MMRIFGKAVASAAAFSGALALVLALGSPAVRGADNSVCATEAKYDDNGGGSCCGHDVDKECTGSECNGSAGARMIKEVAVVCACPNEPGGSYLEQDECRFTGVGCSCEY